MEPEPGVGSVRVGVMIWLRVTRLLTTACAPVVGHAAVGIWRSISSAIVE